MSVYRVGGEKLLGRWLLVSVPGWEVRIGDTGCVP